LSAVAAFCAEERNRNTSSVCAEERNIITRTCAEERNINTKIFNIWFRAEERITNTNDIRRFRAEERIINTNHILMGAKSMPWVKGAEERSTNTSSEEGNYVPYIVCA